MTERLTLEERVEFAEQCGPAVRAAARAMYARCLKLGRAPFSKDDLAWIDLAAIAVETWQEVANTPFEDVVALYERHPDWR